MTNHERLERELYPDADPGDPDAGEPVDDEKSAAASAQQPTATQKFIQASNALRHRSTGRKAPTADELARMTPT